VIVAVIVTVSSFVSYFNSDKVALRMAHAVPADPVKYARYHNLVEGLCIASGLRSRASTSSTIRRPTRSRRAATPSTRRSRSRPVCST